MKQVIIDTLKIVSAGMLVFILLQIATGCSSYTCPTYSNKPKVSKHNIQVLKQQSVPKGMKRSEY